MTLISIDQVASLLAGRIEMLAAELLPGGRRDGREWRCGSLAGEAGQSLGVHLTGAKAGVWADFSTGEVGDALDLVAGVLFRGNKGEALHWSRRWLGLEEGDPAAMATARRQAEERKVRTDKAAADELAAARGRAQALWLRGVPITGTPAEAYLRGRSIDIRALPRPPSALRFLAQCRCTEAGLDLPAMVAQVLEPATGDFLTAHRIWIAPRAGSWASPLPAHQAGSWASPLPAHQAGSWGKAALKEPKKAYCAFAGGIIPLSRGASGRRWREMRGDETVALAEGIETALSVAVLVPEWRVASTVSLANMGRLVLPATWRRVVVCADRDRPDSSAAETLPKVLRHLAAQGAEVLVQVPDEGFKDWNDQLMAELGELAGGAREASA